MLARGGPGDDPEQIARQVLRVDAVARLRDRPERRALSTEPRHGGVTGARGVTHVVMEASGVYTDPVYYALAEQDFDEVAVVNPAHARALRGHKTDAADCRRLAELLKGEITLLSTPGRGSTFSLVLPISVLTLSQPERAGTVPVESPASGAILVAEDHTESRQTLAKVLRRMGYRVLEAGNGRDALAILQQERPLAVLMDVNMPLMDGIDATLAIRADPRLADLPVFFGGGR